MSAGSHKQCYYSISTMQIPQAEHRRAVLTVVPAGKQEWKGMENILKIIAFQRLLWLKRKESSYQLLSCAMELSVSSTETLQMTDTYFFHTISFK